MPIIKSAKKRVRIATKAAIRNSKVRKNMRVATKNFQESLLGKDISNAISAIDIAVKRGVIHKNKAARKKAQIASLAKKNNVKVTKTIKKVTKTVDSKKKTTTKKPIAKKSVPKNSIKK